jgi:hypothetical protein
MKMDKQANKTKATNEFKSFVYITLYFATFFATLTTYKNLILADYRISIYEYFISVIEALILSKVLLIGASRKVGSRFNDKPLIIPALYKTICFSGVLLALAIIERLIRGLWKGMSITDLFKNYAAEKWIILSECGVILSFALIPLFAFWEVNRVLGPDFLRKLFFRKRSRNEAMTNDFGAAIQKSLIP